MCHHHHHVLDPHLVVELVHGELDGEDEDGDERHGHAPVPDLDGEVGQLRLKTKCWCKNISLIVPKIFDLQHALLLVVPAGAALAPLAGAVGWVGGVGEGVVGVGVTYTFLHVN